MGIDFCHVYRVFGIEHEFDGRDYWSHVNFTSHDTDCWTGIRLAIFDTRLIKQSLEVLLTQVLVSLLVSTLYFWISPLSYASSELIARTSPTIWDVLIAIAGGIAGVIGSRKKKQTISCQE